MTENNLETDTQIVIQSEKKPRPFQKGVPPPNGFKKGKGKDRDPHINAKGRPKSFDDLRRMAQSIANEPMLDAKGLYLLDPTDNHVITKGEYVMRQWILSGDSRLQVQFMEICYGKVPQRNENVNIDIGTLTEEQLKLIAEGKSLDDVVGI